MMTWATALITGKFGTGRFHGRAPVSAPAPVGCGGRKRLNLSELLRLSRRRSGLTFRQAHRLTRAIAQILGDGNYAIALGLLSDYEAMGRLPRHIAKIISLCVAYSMDVREFMRAGGVNVDDSEKESLLVRDHPFPVHDELVNPAGLARAAAMGRG